MDVALLQYILKKKKEGISDDEISQKLLLQGWPQDAVTEGLHHVATHPEQVEFHERTFSQTLLGPMELLQNSFALLKENLGSVIFLSIVPSAVGALFVFLSIVIPFAGFNISAVRNLFTSPASIFVAIIFFIVLIIVIGYLYTWCHVALYELLTTRNEKIGWREAMRRSNNKVIPFSWTIFLYSFIYFGGFFLLIIPGIIFYTWFIFTPIIFITEHERGMNALLKSREYIQGIMLPIFLRILFIIGFLMGVSMLFTVFGSLLGSSGSSKLINQIFSFIFNLLITPVSIAYIYLLYENVHTIKGSVQINPKSNDRVGYLVIGLVGILFFAAVFIFAMLLMRNVVKTRMDNAKMIQYQMNTSQIERALEMYYADTGKYPNNLEELIPNYMQRSVLDSPPGPSYQYTTNPDKSDFTLCPPTIEKAVINCISSRVMK